MDDDSVTVVVMTRDRCDRLRTSLTALLALPERPEVIVVDNGSTDNTAAMVRMRFPEVRLLQLRRNAGAPGRNLGVREAGTAVVAFADDDSGWEPGSLAHAADLFRRHPRLGLVAARTLVGPERRPDPMTDFMASAPLGTEDDLPGPSVLGFLACAAIVRRDAFLAVGGFDPVTFFMGEEARVAYDLADTGWGLAYCSDVVSWHDPTPGGSPSRASLADRNQALTAWMRRPVRVALTNTGRLVAAGLRSPTDRRAAGQLAVRLPRALARRRRLAPDVEEQLRRLSEREAIWATGAGLAAGR